MAADLKARLTLNDKNFNAKLEGACRKAQAQLQNVSKASGVLGKSMGGAAGQIGGIISGFSKITGPAALATAGFVGVAASLKDVVENGSKFELALDHLQSLTGVTADKMETFKTQIVNTGVAIHKSASEVAEAYGIVGSKMPELLQDEQALDQVVQAASTLGKAGLMPLEESISALTNIMNQMGASSFQAEQYINALAAGSKNGAGNIQYLSEAFTKAGTNMSAANISFEEGVALIEALSKKFPDAAIAGTRLNKVILALETQNNDKFKPSIEGIIPALKNLSEISGDTTRMTQMFGTANVSAARTLAEMADEIENLKAKVTGTNEAYDQAAINTDNLKSKQDALKTSWENFTTALGSSLPVIKEVYAYLGKCLDFWTQYLNMGGDINKMADQAALTNEIKTSDNRIKLRTSNAGKTQKEAVQEEINIYRNRNKTIFDERKKTQDRIKKLEAGMDANKRAGISNKENEKNLEREKQLYNSQTKAIEANKKVIESRQKALDGLNKTKDKDLKLDDNTKDLKTPKTPKTSTVVNTQKEAEAAAGSLRALEKELQDYQNQYYKGLLPDVSVDEFLKEVKNKEKKIEDERIRLKLDPDPKSLAGLRKTLQDIDNQIERLEPGADPTALLKLRKDTEEAISDLEVTYKLKPSKDSLAAYDAETQRMIDDQMNGFTNYSASDFEKMMEERSKTRNQMEMAIGMSIDHKSMKEAADDLDKNFMQPLSSFEISVGVELPDTPDEWLDWYEQAMNKNDAFIEDWQSILEEAQTKGFTDIEERAKAAIEALQKSNEEIGNSVKKTKEEKDQADKMRSNFNNAADAVGSLGDAFSNLGSSFELPELNVAGVVAQAIAQTALGFAQATSKEAKGGVWYWIAASAAGLANLVAMISQIRSITAYAEGGIISGGSTLGDKNLIRVNAGEAILNKNQQRRLWDILDGQRTLTTTHSQNENVSFVLRGADLYGSINNYKRLTKK